MAATRPSLAPAAEPTMTVAAATLPGSAHAQTTRSTGLFDAPLWASGFRPFFLLGNVYGVALMLAWAATQFDDTGAAIATWHGREMLFGFALAIIAGVIMTALPSWAGTAEIRGGRLALLVALWLLGRIAFWSAAWWPPGWARVAEALFVPALLTLLALQLWHVAQSRYRWVLPLLGALYAAQLLAPAFGLHIGIAAAHGRTVLQATVYIVIVLYVLVGGLLTSVFTGNALRAHRLGAPAQPLLALEIAAVIGVVVLALADLGGAERHVVGAIALGCLVLHGWRITRWRGWRAADDAVVLAMNLGFAWLLLAFALRAAAAFGAPLPADVWLHAFTVGSLGLMMLGLMSRVALRHSGRALHLPASLLVAGALVFGAALLRVAEGEPGRPTMAWAALLWAFAFASWLWHFAPLLVAPSLPRQAAPTLAESGHRVGSATMHLPGEPQ